MVAMLTDTLSTRDSACEAAERSEEEQNSLVQSHSRLFSRSCLGAVPPEILIRKFNGRDASRGYIRRIICRINVMSRGIG